MSRRERAGHEVFTNIHPVNNKSADREALQHDINMYLMHGKTIEEVPPGVSGAKETKMTKRNGKYAYEDQKAARKRSELRVRKRDDS